MTINTNRDTENLLNHIDSLASGARYLLQAGQDEAAGKIYRQILNVAPYHAEALNYLAHQAMNQANFQESATLLQKAIEGNARNSVTFENLGLVYLAQGNHDAALDSFNQALKLDPASVIAAANRTLLLDRLGRHEDALRWSVETYRILGGRVKHYVNSPQVAYPLRQSIISACGLWMTELKLQLNSVMDTLHTNTGAADLGRLEQSLRLFVGDEDKVYADALQRPAFFFYEGLKSSAFHDATAFPWRADLENGIGSIRQECAALLNDPGQFKPYVSVPSGQDPQQWRELNLSPNWSAFHLYRNGTRIEEHCAACPRTIALLESLLPLVHIPGHAPEIFFSVMSPGTRIPPHYGLANYKLALHIPLVLTADSAIRVGHEVRSWEEDHCLVFDDSFQHEAWNNSSSQRVVLIADIWHPELTSAEQQGIAEIIPAINHFMENYGIVPSLYMNYRD